MRRLALALGLGAGIGVGVRTQHFGGRAKDQAIHEELAKQLR